jgi:hypothetical protein
MTVAGRVLFVLILALVGVSAAVAAPGKLRVTDVSLFTVRGTGFHAGEHVRVVVDASDAGAAKRVTAGAAGAFVVRFPGVELGSCPIYRVRAVGDMGTSAALTVRQPECAQPKQP